MRRSVVPEGLSFLVVKTIEGFRAKEEYKDEMWINARPDDIFGYQCLGPEG